MALFHSHRITAQSTFESSSTQAHPLGFYAETSDGRGFRYAQVGATALIAGKLYQSAATLPNHLANTPPAVAIGAYSFSYTPGATAGAANLYAEGYLQVDTTPGQGYTYQVSGHAAITASTAFTLHLKDPIQVALTTDSRVGLIAHPYKNIIVAPATTVTAKPVGVASAPHTAAYYGFVQTHGPCSLLIDGTPAITAPIINGAVDGAAAVWTALTQPTTNLIGHMMQVGVDTKYNFVFLEID